MSYTTHEPLSEIVQVLRTSLPGLKNLLAEGTDVATLHPTVEMISSLVARFERGEIIEQPKD